MSPRSKPADAPATDTPEARSLAYRDLAALVPDPRNPKAHDGALIEDSVGRFGYIEPIVEDARTGRLISGHGRVEALRAMRARGESPPEGVTLSDDGAAWLVPVVTGWGSRTDSEARAALIALNRTTELGGWVDAALLDALEELSAMDGGFVGVGYEDADLDDLRAMLQELDAAPGPGVVEDEMIGVRSTPSIGDYAVKYEEQGRRLIVLEYTSAEYAMVTARLRVLREEQECTSNTGAVASLLARMYPDVKANAPAPALPADG